MLQTASISPRFKAAPVVVICWDNAKVVPLRVAVHQLWAKSSVTVNVLAFELVNVDPARFARATLSSSV